MTILRLLDETWQEWRKDRAAQQSAALAFYALFSIAPLVLVATAVVSAVFGTDAAEERLARELQGLLTPQIADAVRVLVRNAANGRSPWAAGGLGILVSFYGAARGFFQLQSTLDHMWGVRALPGATWVELIRRNLLAFASVASCGSLLMVSLVATIVLHGMADSVTTWFDAPLFAVRLVEEASSFALVSVLLMVIYKTLPDVRIRWRDVVVGSLVSAGLFVIGKHAIAWYLRHVGSVSTFGAASAIVALMLYVQYTAQVLLFGAEFTFVFARWQGRPIVAGPGAERIRRSIERRANGTRDPDDIDPS